MRQSVSEQGWAAKHTAFKKKHNIEGEPSWTSLHGAQCRGLAGKQREKDLIDVAVAMAQKSSRSEVGAGEVDMIVDISQSLHRTPWVFIDKKTMTSLTTSSTLWWRGGGRVLQPVEHFALMGWGKVKTSELSQSALRDLSGESMPLPMMAVAILSLLFSVEDWWGERSED
eukprot:6487784-Amphidinium_carterae.4